VCEILKNLPFFNGKTISVRGTVSGGGHGAFLVDNCSSQVVVKGFVWRDAIFLAFHFHRTRVGAFPKPRFTPLPKKYHPNPSITYKIKPSKPAISAAIL
jgi:hypothetical protein